MRRGERVMRCLTSNSVRGRKRVRPELNAPAAAAVGAAASRDATAPPLLGETRRPTPRSERADERSSHRAPGGPSPARGAPATQGAGTQVSSAVPLPLVATTQSTSPAFGAGFMIGSSLVQSSFLQIFLPVGVLASTAEQNWAREQPS